MTAAAFIFGPTLALAQLYTPELNTVGLSDLSGLALTQTEVLPHNANFSAGSSALRSAAPQMRGRIRER